jgi:hypothetical protein
MDEKCRPKMGIQRTYAKFPIRGVFSINGFA